MLTSQWQSLEVVLAVQNNLNIFQKKNYGPVLFNPQKSFENDKKFMRITLVVKTKNRRKHNSHEWFIGKIFGQRFKMEVLKHEIHNFQAFITEFAFVIRTFFFVIFGASLDFRGLFDAQKLLVALAIIASIYVLRFVYFKATGDDKDNTLWFVAPRGLITILLFYSIPDEFKLVILDQDVLLMVILASVFILAIGSMYKGNKGNGAVAADDVQSH
jgi:hypothetical protein